MKVGLDILKIDEQFMLLTMQNDLSDTWGTESSYVLNAVNF